MTLKITFYYAVCIVVMATSCKKNEATSLVKVNFISYSPPDFFPEQIIVSIGDTAVFTNSSTRFSITAPLTPFIVNLPIGKRWVNISGSVSTSAGTLPFNFNQPINVIGNNDTIILGNIASDFRYKKNITSTVAKNLMPRFMQLQEYSYQYKVDDFPSMHFPNDYTYGFIAQDVEKIMPWLVSKNSEGYRSVNYMAVIPILTAVVQQQQQQIEVLNNDMRLLKNNINFKTKINK